MMKKSLLSILASIAIGTAVVSCSEKTSDPRPVLVVSVPAQAEVLRQIAGNDYRIVTLLDKGANPETWEPTMRTRADVEGARAMFTAGYLPFEDALAMSLPDSVRVVNTSEGISLIYGTHGHSHAEGHADCDHDVVQPDPHTWLSVRNLSVMASNMAQTMQAINPAKKEVYAARLAEVTAHLSSADSTIQATLKAPGAAHAFAVWHPSLTYFARDYGLKQVAVGFENKEMSASHLTRVAADAKADSVRVMFFQRQHDSRQAQTLNNAMGTRLADFDPMSANVTKSLQDAAAQIAK